MFRLFSLLCCAALFSACHPLLYRGTATMPHLEGKGDLQLAGHATLSGALIGVHSQAAYAINDQWGVQATLCVLNTAEFNASPFNRFRSYEAGAMRMFGSSGHGLGGTSYVLQAGFGHSQAMLQRG
ncbi:MAG: hypothetical protein ACK417_12300 [Bacteroidia bacterium]